jgi:alpha-L-fucosidase 2
MKKLTTRLLFAALLTQAALADDLELWYSQPATKWLEALPIGNGSLGAMIFGGTTNERVQFNEQTLWLGSETEMGSYQPFGDVFATWQHDSATEYRRELSLDDAIHRVSYRAGGVEFQREAFASFPQRVLVYRFTANQSGAYSGVIRLADVHGARVSATGNTITSVGMLTNGMAYEAQLRVLHDGGTVSVAGNSIVVTKADSVTLLLSAGTSFANDPLKNWRGEHPHGRATERLEAAGKQSYAELRKAHLADYQALFNRLSLTLGAATSALPTDARLAARAKAGTDPGLEALLFHYGRYLLISSSRPGGLPANLQGIWNQDVKPAWYSGYTANINLQMNYWPAEVTGLTECAEPLFQYIQNLAVVYKRTQDDRVKPPKGRGWSAYSTTNPFGGSSRWGVHRPHSAWLVQHLWEHYAFTGDTNFLRLVAYPAMREVVEFWEDRMVEGPDGTLITPDGWSPEHGPVNVNGKIVLQNGDRTPHPGTSYDQQIVWDLFNNFVEASGVLGADAAYAAKVQAMRDRLLGPKIGRWGQLQEWMEDVDDPMNTHRHTSHLFALHPGRQISPLTTPELAQAVRVSLKARGDLSTGWSKAWRMCFWARLGDGDRVYQLISGFVKPLDDSRTRGNDSYDGGFYPNLFDGHPPFQIDGNFGYTAGVCEMLLQSHLRPGGTNLIQLLPALPGAWPQGSVTGLCARGGFVVDMAWRDGKLTSAVVRSRNGGTARICYGAETREVKLAPGTAFRWE